MAQLGTIERRKLETLLEMGGGYVLDFSNRTFEEFIAENTGLEIYDEKYLYGSGSKANRLRGFFKVERDAVVAELIRNLVTYTAEIRKDVNPELIADCYAVADRLARLSTPSAQQLPLSSTPKSPEEQRRITAFLSYSWDCDNHKDWVRQLADKLSSNGIKIILDQYDLRLGNDKFQFMESSVRSADVVLCICTPGYVHKANSRMSGVGVETSLLTRQFYERMRTAKQFIPIIRNSDGVTDTPDYLASMIFIDFRDDSNFDARTEELLRHLHDQPKYPKPPVGLRPNFT